METPVDGRYGTIERCAPMQHPDADPLVSAEDGSPVRCVSRFFALLRTLNDHGPSSLLEMVRATGISYQSTGRIVQTMVCHGLVELVPGTRSYRVAAMALSLSHGFQAPDRLAAAARPAIAALTARVGWPIEVTARVGAAMVVLASTHHLTSLSLGPCPAGTSIPLLPSAAGRVFLAHATHDERCTVLDGLQRQDVQASPVVDVRLFDRIRVAGYATDERIAYAAHPGRTSSISVPIHLRGHGQGVLSLVFFASALPMETAVSRFVDELRRTSLTIEDALVGPLAAPRDRSIAP